MLQPKTASLSNTSLQVLDVDLEKADDRRNKNRKIPPRAALSALFSPKSPRLPSLISLKGNKDGSFLCSCVSWNL